MKREHSRLYLGAQVVIAAFFITLAGCEGTAIETPPADGGDDPCADCGLHQQCLVFQCICNDSPQACTQAGDVVCVGNAAYATCTVDDDGCMYLETPTNCPFETHQCLDGICICVRHDFDIGDKRCPDGIEQVEICEQNVQTGWREYVASLDVLDICGQRQECVDDGAGVATFECDVSAGQAVGNTCTDTKEVGNCVTDVDGCLYVESTATCPSDLQDCNAGVCECANNQCNAGDRGCNLAADQVGVCQLDVADGCLVMVASVDPQDICGAGEECVEDGMGGAVCQCVATTCVAEGPICVDATTTGSCVTDTDGCLYVDTPTACPSGLQTCNGATGLCECPVGGCTLDYRDCNVDGDQVEVCEWDVAGGCPVMNTSSLPADDCVNTYAHKECVADGMGAADCECWPTICSADGPMCISIDTEAVCATDTDGCLFAVQAACTPLEECQVTICGCIDNLDCDPAYNCDLVNNVCVIDPAPYVIYAFAYGGQTIRVTFSEDMLSDGSIVAANQAANYCIEDFDGDASICTFTADFSINGLSIVDGQSFDVSVSNSLLDKDYTVKVNSRVQDSGGIGLTAPVYADFAGIPTFELLSAQTQSTTTVKLVFSKPWLAGPDTAGSADCTTIAECANRYLLTGATNLGAVTDATIQAAPEDNTVIITHENPQAAETFTVIAANATDGDGFDDAAWGAINSAAADPLGADPADRVTFEGMD